MFVALAWASTALAGGGEIFRPADIYPSGDGETFRITKGDFNRDGELDLAATGLVLGDFRSGRGVDAAVANKQDPGSIAVFLNR